MQIILVLLLLFGVHHCKYQKQQADRAEYEFKTEWRNQEENCRRAGGSGRVNTFTGECSEY